MLESVLRHRSEIRAIAAAHGATSIALFGSVARGEAQSNSDLDFAVDVSEGTSLFDLARLRAALVDLLDTDVDVVPAKGLDDGIRSRFGHRGDPPVNEADRLRLDHILDQLQRIERYAAGGRSEFDGDDIIQDVLRCLSVIGEAAAALTPDTAKSLPSLPPHLPRGMRNRLVHEYCGSIAASCGRHSRRTFPP